MLDLHVGLFSILLCQCSLGQQLFQLLAPKTVLTSQGDMAQLIGNKAIPSPKH
jgi:hypothetical protein